MASKELRRRSDALAKAWRAQYRAYLEREDAEPKLVNANQLERATGVHRAQVRALIKGLPGRPSEKRILDLGVAIGVGPEELLADAAAIQTQGLDVPFRTDRLPAIAGALDPHAIVLRWAFEGNVHVRRGDLRSDPDEIVTRRRLKMPFYLRPATRVQDLLTEDRANPLFAPFVYATFGRVAELRRERAGFASAESLMMLAGWRFDMRPGFVLLERQAGGSSSKTAVASQVERGNSSTEILDGLRSALTSRVLLVPGGETAFRRVVALLDFLEVEQTTELPPDERELSGSRPYSVIQRTHGTRGALELLEGGHLRANRVLVAGAAQYWACRRPSRCGVRMIISDEDLLPDPSGEDALPDAGSLEPRRRELQRLLAAMREADRHVIVTVEGLHSPDELDFVASYIQFVSRELQLRWRETNLLPAVNAEYRKYGGAGIPFDGPRMELFIDQGMRIELAGEGEPSAFRRLESFEAAQQIGSTWPYPGRVDESPHPSPGGGP